MLPEAVLNRNVLDPMYTVSQHPIDANATEIIVVLTEIGERGWYEG